MLKLTEANINSNIYLRADRELGRRITTLETYTGSNYSVKKYGAVGDGVHDDTAAITACIAANNKQVFFPMGTYKITNELLIENKPANMKIVSDSAVLVQTLPVGTEAGKYCMKVINCERFVVDGTLTMQSSTNVNIRPAEISTGTGNGFYVSNCADSKFHNLTVLGPFIKGIVLDTSLGLRMSSLSSLVVKNCVVGCEMQGEYYQIGDSNFSYNRTGVLVTGGNNSIVTSHLMLNRIGIYVLGGGANADHGKIVDCTVNHNVACGIFIKNTTYSEQITGCEIWAQIKDNTNLGFLPDTLTNTEILSTAAVAASTAFGVYLQNVECINFTGNTVARNRINMGLDGYCVCTISDNIFNSDNSRTTGHLIEYGGSHDAFTRNVQNTVCNNAFYGSYLNGNAQVDKRMIFFNNTGISTLDNSTIIMANNVGTTGMNYLGLGGTGGAATEFVMDPNYSHLLLNVTSNAIVKLHSALGGSPVQIYITGITSGQTKYVELASASTYNGNNTPIIIGTGCTYDIATKRYTFSVNGLYSFAPIGPFVNQWVINCP